MHHHYIRVTTSDKGCGRWALSFDTLWDVWQSENMVKNIILKWWGWRKQSFINFKPFFFFFSPRALAVCSHFNSCIQPSSETNERSIYKRSVSHIKGTTCVTFSAFRLCFWCYRYRIHWKNISLFWAAFKLCKPTDFEAPRLLAVGL